MNILRFFFLAVMTLAFSLPLGAVPSVEEQRTQAAQLIKKLEARADKAEFKKIPAANTGKNLQEVASMYQKLLETVDDEHSGSDLDNYLFSAIAAALYDHTIGDQNKIYATAASSYAKHANNTSYLIALWHLGRQTPEILPAFFPKYFSPVPPASQSGRVILAYPSDPGRIFSLLKLGETILQKGQGNVTPSSFAQFLMEYGNYWNRLPYTSPNNERLAAYGYRHLLTPLDADPITIPLFRYSKDNYALLNTTSQPLEYGIPASWQAAKNDGERIHYLFHEAKRLNPVLTSEIRLIKAEALRDAFSPVPTIIINKKIADLNLIYQFVPGNSMLRERYWDNKQQFFALLSTLAPNETLLPQGEESLKIKLPESLNYISELQALSQAEIHEADSGKGKQDPAYYQVKARNTATEILIDEWINRLNYDKAKAAVEPFLTRLKKENSAIKDPEQKNANDYLYEKLDLLQKQLTGKKAFFPNNGFPDGGSRFVSGDKVRLPLLYRKAAQLDVRIHKIDIGHLLKEAAQLKKAEHSRYDTSFLNPFSLNRNPEINRLFLPHPGKPLSSPLIPGTPLTAGYHLSPQPQGKDTLDFITLPKLESGYYFIEGQTDENDYSFGKIIYVGNLNMAEFPTTGNVTVQLTDYTSGTPIKGAQVQVLALDAGNVKPDSDNVSSRSFSATTDDKGLVNLPVEGLEADQKRYFLITAQINGNFLYYLTSSDNRQNLKNTLKRQNDATVEIITDRKVYRPGQTVHWQAWVGNANYQTGGKLLADYPVNVEFSELAPKFEGKTDSHGIVSGSFVIPPATRLDSYSISLNGKDISSSSTSFSVEEYKKPDFEVSLSSGKETLLFGENATITVSVNYYSGEPVTQGTVILNLSTNKYNPQAPGTFALQKTLPLNSQGQASLNFKIPAPSGKENEENPASTLFATATVSDSSLRQVEENKNFVVSALPFIPTINTDTSFGRAGERMSATVLLKKYSGVPASAQGEATLYFLPEGVKPPLKREKIISWNIATNAEGKALLSFLPPKGGFFLLETVFPVNPDKNSYASTETIFPVLPGKDDKTPIVTGIDTFKIYSEKQKYKPGENAKLLLITPEKSARVELKTNLLYSNEKIYSIPVNALFTEYELPVTLESAPTLLIRASALANGKLFSAEHFISIFTSDHKIDLSAHVAGKEASTDAPLNNIPAFSPREQANVKVKVLSRDGKPVTGTPVAISVYDKALEVFYQGYQVNFNQHPFWSTYKSPLSWIGGYSSEPISSSDTYLQKETWNSDFIQKNYSKNDYYLNRSYSDNITRFYTREESKSYSLKQKEILIPLMGQFAAWSLVEKEDNYFKADENRVLTPGQKIEISPDSRQLLVFPGQLSLTGFPQHYLFGQYVSFLDGDRSYFTNRLSASPITKEFSLSPASFNFAKGQRVLREKARSPMIGDSILKQEASSFSDPFASESLSTVAGSWETPASGASDSQTPAQQTPVTRRDFADLLKWSGSLITDENGVVELPLTMPDNLTTWKVKAWSVDKSLNSGECAAEFVTTRDFIAQLQTTRFLVAQDKSLASAVIRNYTDIPQTIQISLKIKGDSLSINTQNTPEVQGIVVPAKGTVTVNWEITAQKEGNALLTLQALGEKVSDASEQSLPISIRGAFNSLTLDINLTPGDASSSAEFTIPEEIKKEMTQAYVSVSPGLAPAILKALPYLSSYPYGCMEQTMNRFVPTIIVSNTFRELDIDADKLLALALPAPEGQNPLKDKKTLEKQIQDGITRLANAQGSNNWSQNRGWSWFAGGMEMDPYITAQIVHGLNLALEKDSPWRDSMLAPAVNALAGYEQNREEILGSDKHPSADATDVFVHYVLNEQKKASPKMLAYLLRDRKEYTPFTLTQLGLILQSQGEKKVLDSLLSSLKSLVKTDKKAQTAWLDLPSNRDWWTWQNDLVETQASYLKLLTATHPGDETARLLARWLVLNRENSFYWKSTRDTALVIEALCGYMKTTGEGLMPLSLELLVDGKVVKTVTYDPARLEEFSGDLILTPDALPPGKHTLELRRQSGDGKTPVYLAAGIRYFSTAQKLQATGTDLKVDRKYARVTTTKDDNGELTTSTAPLKDGEELKSGDVLEVTLKVTAQNDYQYLILRDPKPAGCEPFNLISGYNNAFAGNSDSDLSPSEEDPFDNSSLPHGPGPVLPPAQSYYTELADRETRVFMPALPRGEHYITYKLRVERPGTYTALPAEVEAMYAPILRGNSNDRIITIQIPASVTEAARKAQAQEPEAPAIGTGDETAREAFDMAFRSSLGWIEELDRNLSFRWMKKAAEGGYLPALVTLGNWTKNREDIPDHEQEAIALYRQALPKLQAQAGSEDPEIQVSLGKLYLMDEKTAKAIGLGELPFTKRMETGMAHMKKAIELFQQAEDQGSGYASCRLGNMYLGQGIQYSPQMALEHFEKGAETGYAPCVFASATLITDNPDKRERYLERAAKAKMTPAAEMLAFAYFSHRDDKGYPDKDSILKGLPYLHQAAEGGAPDAQLCLSELYRKGDHVAQDEDKATFWEEKAKDGHAESQWKAWPWRSRLTPDTNPLLRVLYGKDRPEEGTVSIKSVLPPAPVPESLPERSGQMDGKTDGELLDAWKKGNLQAFAELGVRPFCTGIIDIIPITREDYRRKNSLAREGNTLTAYELALLLMQSPFTEDNELGMEWLRLLARTGHAQATLILVSRLMERHPEEALALALPLAERNSSATLGLLESIFGQTGMGAELNPARALAYRAQRQSLYNIKEILPLIRRDQKKLDPGHISTFLRSLDNDTKETRNAQENKELKALIKQQDAFEKSREKKK